MSIQATIRKVTPQWAAEVLDRTSRQIAEGKLKQRRVSNVTVLKYAADMQSGDWAITGQGISFDDEGKLIDGQHRLMAVVRAGKSINMLVTTGLLATTGGHNFKTIHAFDIGRNRKLPDQLMIEGYRNTALMASVVRNLAVMATSGIIQSVSNPQGIAILEKIVVPAEKLVAIVCKGDRWYNGRGYIIASLVMLYQSKPEETELFATDYNELVNLKKGSPVLAAYKYFNSNEFRTRSGYVATKKAQLIMATALRAYCEDRTLEYIKGAQEDMDWLISKGKGLVNFIRDLMRIRLRNS